MYNVWLSCLLILSSVLLSNLVFYGIRKRKVAGILFFTILMIAMIIHSLGYAFELLSNTVEQMYLCTQIEYIGVAFYPFLIMLFAREYADEKKFANRYSLTLMLTINIVTLVLVNTNSYHWLYYSSVGIDSAAGFNMLTLDKNVWYYVQVVSLYVAILYSIIVFSTKLKRARGGYRKQVIFMIIGTLIPITTSVIYFLGLGPVYIDLSPFSYFFMSLFLAVGLLKYDILFLAPVTYEMVFNSIGEAVLVINKEHILVNFNNASKNFFPSLSKIKIGESVHFVQELKDYDFKGKQSIYEINGRILNFKAIHIKNNKVSVYVVNDITESERVKKQLEILAREDSLTGLYNRRFFMSEIQKSSKESILAIIDIDYFKLANDTFGHVEGDKVLSYFGGELKDFFKEELVCRYGGEEFAIFMEGINMEEAFNKIERFREKIKGSDMIIKITFSAGLAKCKRENISEALIQADTKLYEAKEKGRNQTRY